VRGGCGGRHRNQPALDSLLVAGLPLLILAFQARRISSGIPDHDALRRSRVGASIAHASGDGRSGIVQGLRVILELPPQSPPLSPAGWLATTRLTKQFQSDPRAEEVLSLPTLTGMSDTAEAVDDVPESIRRVFFAAMATLPCLSCCPPPLFRPTNRCNGFEMCVPPMSRP